MKQFNPPIEQRDTIELIAIANGSVDEWQQEAINHAKDELKKRKISIEYQQIIISNWKAEERQFKLNHQKRLESNRHEGYPTLTMIYIFLVAPLILLGRWKVGPSLWELKSENYQKKFGQRILLLLGGTIFWASYIVYEINSYEKERQEEINNVDISAWKKSYYGEDSSRKSVKQTDSFNTNN